MSHSHIGSATRYPWRSAPSRPALGLLFALLALTPAAQAGVVATGGSVTLVASPPDVRTGVLESDTAIQLFAEQRGVTLAAALSVDLTAADTYDAVTPITPGVIAAGTVVNSYFLHLDRVGTGGPVITLSGSATFDEPILGIIISNTNLDLSDGILGTSIYSTGADSKRGLLTYGGDDIVTWTGTSRIDVELPIYYSTDQVRVVTYAGPRGVTFSIDRQSTSFGVMLPAFGVGTGGVGGQIGEGDLLTVGTAAPGPNPAVVAPPPPGVFINSTALGLSAMQAREVDAISYGRDQVPNGRAYFSVDEFAVSRGGAAYAPLRNAALAAEAAADVFRTTDPAPLIAPVIAGIQARVDGDGAGGVRAIGLVEPSPAGTGVPDFGDNLDALDVDTAPQDAGGPVYYSLDAGFDDPLEGGVGWPNYNSACLLEIAMFGGGVCPTFTGADIFIKTPAAPVSVYADEAVLGLNAGDDVDALALWDDGDQIFDAAVDRIYFSLRRNSATIGAIDSLLGLPIEEGDVLTVPAAGGATPAIAIPAERLGLRTLRSGSPLPWGYPDDLDALDFVKD